MPDFTSVAGPFASLVAAISALPLGRLAQNRQEVKVRASIESSTKFAKELEKIAIDNKKVPAQKIETALENDFDALNLLVEARNQEKRRNWAILAVAVFTSGILTIPLWFLWRLATVQSWSIFLVFLNCGGPLHTPGRDCVFQSAEEADESGKK